MSGFAWALYLMTCTNHVCVEHKLTTYDRKADCVFVASELTLADDTFKMSCRKEKI